MDRERAAASLGIVAAGAVLVLTALPYAFTRAEPVGTYYSVGLVSPAFVSLLSVIVAITLLSAARGRSDPALSAGVALTVSAFTVVLALLWALPAAGVVSGIDVPTWFGYHPAAIVLTTLLSLLASALHTRGVL